MQDDAHSDIWQRAYDKAHAKAVDAYIKGEITDSTHIKARARQAADKAAARGTEEGWDNIRMRVWKRDKGICQVCLKHIKFEQYQCGHIVDRMCGGTDLDENLVVMCSLCNEVLKPPHETRAEYDAWIKRVRAHEHASDIILDGFTDGCAL